MSGSDDVLLDLATAIAEGRRVDWPEATTLHPELAEQLESLRQLEGLAEGLAKGLARDTTAANTSKVGLPASWGHLKLAERIGEGSFGEVWRAFDPVLRRDVALKLVRPEAEEVVGSDFIHEARRLARLRHPHIVGVHGADVHDGRVGLWSELLEGPTLAEEIDGGFEEGWERRLEIARQLASALAAVHRAGLVHGDVKAANVVVDRGVAVLTDFGAGADLETSDHPGPAWGSPLTAAPERFEGAPLAPPADVFSLGVLLYRLFGDGSYPFEAGDLDGIRALHRQRSESASTSRRPVRQKAVSPRLPRALPSLVEQMLAPRPGDRPSAAEVEERLRWIEQAPKRRRRRLAVTAVIASLVLGLVAMGVAYLHARSAAEQEQLARRDAEDVSRFLGEVLGAPRASAAGRQVLVIDVLDTAARRVEATLEPGSPARARIWQLIGRTYLALERPREAEELLRRAIPELDEAYSPSHPLAILARLQLSSALCGQKDQDLAVCDGLVAEAAELATEMPGDAAEAIDIPSWIEVHRAASARRHGDFAEAERVLERALATRAPAAPGQDSMRDLLEVRLSGIRLSLGKYEMVAEALKGRASEFEAAYGIRHGHTMSTLNDLGVALASLGRRHEALEILEHLAAETADWLGPMDPYTIRAQGNVVAILKDLGDVARAAALEEDLSARARESFGSEHMMTLQLESNLAYSWKLLGRIEEAERLNEELVGRATRALGRHHPLSHILAVNRSELYLETGRQRQALVLATAARDVMLERLPPEHLFVLAIQSVQGAALCDVGRVGEGLDLLRSTLEAQRALAGAEDHQALITQVRLGEGLARAGERDEARLVLTEAEQLAREALGEEHYQTAAARKALERLGET